MSAFSRPLINRRIKILFRAINYTRRNLKYEYKILASDRANNSGTGQLSCKKWPKYKQDELERCRN
jgi:hypothetical protein